KQELLKSEARANQLEKILHSIFPKNALFEWNAINAAHAFQGQQGVSAINNHPQTAAVASSSSSQFPRGSVDTSKFVPSASGPLLAESKQADDKQPSSSSSSSSSSSFSSPSSLLKNQATAPQSTNNLIAQKPIIKTNVEHETGNKEQKQGQDDEKKTEFANTKHAIEIKTLFNSGDSVELLIGMHSKWTSSGKGSLSLVLDEPLHKYRLMFKEKKKQQYLFNTYVPLESVDITTSMDIKWLLDDNRRACVRFSSEQGISKIYYMYIHIYVCVFYLLFDRLETIGANYHVCTRTVSESED
ncbi:hypothetical protein RFI_33091, partial [Reticulomyxa filosa]